MSSFINPVDYDASIHEEILAAITRNDPTVIELAEDMAIQEMAGYLSQRYDCDQIFAETDDLRNKLILMFAIDITLYHLHCAHNPQRFPKNRQDRYDRAIAWLQEVQKGRVIPSGLQLKINNEGNQGGGATFSIIGNPKRGTHF